MTTFERIFRSEDTTAAHVSSADDSRARTVKFLEVLRVRESSPDRYHLWHGEKGLVEDPIAMVLYKK